MPRCSARSLARIEPLRFSASRMARRVVGMAARGGSIGAAPLGSRQDQMDVAELVPQVPLGQIAAA